MRRFFLSVCVVLSASSARAQSSGVGVIIGNPVALTGKFFLDAKRAIDAGLALNFSDYSLIYGDYLLHFPGVFGKSNAVVAHTEPYLGFGALLAITNIDRANDDNFRGRRPGTVGLGVRIPFGAEWRPTEPSIGVFVELVPGISLIPMTSGIFQGGAGIRYYF